ncbi:MAG: four helix bundle protein [Proteobacteria bacterium]|jgi:four helix bundle protein|nr:four helix bundle protein [Pseudomonadota bacterium]
MEKRIETFEDLLVWQKGIELVKQIYILTGQEKFRNDFALRDQIRRAAISISTNIAEGFERSSRKEYLHFLNIAKGSAGEVRSLLRVTIEIGYIDPSTYDHLRNAILELSRYLSNQIRSLKGRIQ